MKKHFVGLTTVCLALIMGVSSVSAFTPPGLAKKDGLPPGIQKKFIQDTKEMKYIRDVLELLEKKGIKDLKELINILEKKDINEYNTTIKDMDVKERRILIEDGTAVLSLLISKEAKIHLNDKVVKLEELRKKDKISIKLDKNRTVIELKATREKEDVKTERLEGKILGKYEGKEPLIIIQIDQDIEAFYVEKDVDISEVKAGKQGIIYLEDNKITSIRIR